ncbi:MAG: cysteine desulfurase NifS [Chloroflexi bacterium]|nr:cysteine desulfurase NifS [Chloroflexota bacterium]
MIYLDNAASTQIRQEVLEVINKELVNSFANPSSPYSPARNSRIAVDNARKIFSKIMNCDDNEIIFTSGGTESDNTAIKGPAYALKNIGNHIITTATEHHAVLHTCNNLEKQGFDITYLPTDKYGMVNREDVISAIRENTILVSVIYANNELGSINPIQEIGEAIKKYKGKNSQFPLFHTDAVQAATYLDLNVDKLGVDLMSISAHKFNGPKGIGALYMKNGIPFEPLITGGGQERQKRSGTENIAFISGSAEAIRLAEEEKIKLNKMIMALKNKITDHMINKHKDILINGHPTKSLPNIINLTIPDVRADDLISALDLEDICISNGSACTSNSLEPSHVLKSIGMEANLALNTIRISLGRNNTESEIIHFLNIIDKIIERIRKNKKEFITNN